MPPAPPRALGRGGARPRDDLPPAVRWIDRETGWTIFRYTPGALAILGTFVGSMLTFIVFVLSTLIVVQLAAGS